MPSAPPQPVQLACPACGAAFRAAVYTLIDGGEQPELKAALLSGQLNVAVCPSCRTPSMLGAPLVYHDASKQLCLIYFPQELNSRPQEQERFVGEATSFLLRALPPETPRAHLLAPRRFLTMQSLMEAIFEADGVSVEDLRRQSRHAEMISELAGLVGDEEQFRAGVARLAAELTPEFLATLEAFIGATPEEQAETRQLLLAVREGLAAMADGAATAADDEELAAAIDRLAAAPDEELELAVADLRQLIDYGFFAAWSERIAAAEAAGDPAAAAALTERRGRILAIVEELDQAAQEMFERGSALLSAALATDDPAAALRARGAEVDEGLLMVISANIGAAQRTGQDGLAAALDELGAVAQQIIEERLSPEDRFIGELLALETPQEATRLIRKSFARISPELIRRLNELAETEERRANKPLADRLRQLARECGAMLF